MGIWRKNASRHWGLTMTDMSDLNKLLEKIDDEMLENVSEPRRKLVLWLKKSLVGNPHRPPTG